MDRNQLQKMLEFVKNKDLGVKVDLILKERNTTVFKNAELDEELHKNLLRQFRRKVEQLFLENEYTLEHIDKARENRKDELYYFENSAELPPSLIELQQMPHTLPKFSFDKDPLHDITGLMITLGYENQNIRLYKKHSNLQTQSAIQGKVLRIFPKESRFTLLPYDVLNISDSFSFLFINDVTIIYHLETLENKFGYMEVIKQKATNTIGAIKAHNLVEDVSLLYDIVKDNNTTLTKKLQRIGSTSPVLKLNIPPEEVIQFVKKNPRIANLIKISKTNKHQISVDNKKAIERFIKLMDDAYVTSLLTGLWYDSLDKDEMK
jgi:hypothetical protein